MIYKVNLRKKNRQTMELQEKKINNISANGNMSLVGNKFQTLKNINLSTIKGLSNQKEIREEENIENEEEVKHEESDEDENLLTIDESMNMDNENVPRQQNQNDAEEQIDEMFLVNQIKTQSIIRVMRFLKFLQLLTEGHHTELQNFLREQTYSNGVVNQKSFDFISYVA